MTEDSDKPQPGWARFVPNERAWATLGMFLIVWRTIELIAANPALAENHLFTTVATLLIGSGAFGLCCAFLWGGSKASAAAADTVNSMAKKNTAAPAPGTVTTTTTPADPASPTPVVVTNDTANPVPTTDAPPDDPFRIKP